MKDKALSHSAHGTLRELLDRMVNLVPWPSYSSYVNSIESIWFKIKFVKTKYSDFDGRKRVLSKKLREVIEEAGDSILGKDLKNHVKCTPARCQDMVCANGGHTNLLIS